MYNYRLWLELSESEFDYDLGSLESKSQEVHRIIRENLNCKPTECIHDVNYIKLLQCAGGANHRSKDHEILLKVLKEILQILPGSQGLVYWDDDEAEDSGSGSPFNVIVVSKGRLQHKSDSFLLD